MDLICAPHCGTLLAKATRGNFSGTCRGIGRYDAMPMVNHRPPQHGKLIEERLFDMEVF